MDMERLTPVEIEQRKRQRNRAVFVMLVFMVGAYVLGRFVPC